MITDHRESLYEISASDQAHYDRVLPASGADARSAVDLIRHETQVHGNDVETLSIDGIGFKGAMLPELTDPEDLAIEVFVPPTDFQLNEDGT